MRSHTFPPPHSPSEQWFRHRERRLFRAVIGRRGGDARHVGPGGECQRGPEAHQGGSCPGCGGRERWGTRSRAGVPAGPSLPLNPLQAAKANLEKAQAELLGAADEAARAEIQIRIEANEALVKALE